MNTVRCPVHHGRGGRNTQHPPFCHLWGVCVCIFPSSLSYLVRCTKQVTDGIPRFSSLFATLMQDSVHMHDHILGAICEGEGGGKRHREDTAAREIEGAKQRQNKAILWQSRHLLSDPLASVNYAALKLHINIRAPSSQPCFVHARGMLMRIHIYSLQLGPKIQSVSCAA